MADPPRWTGRWYCTGCNHAVDIDGLACNCTRRSRSEVLSVIRAIVDRFGSSVT